MKGIRLYAPPRPPGESQEVRKPGSCARDAKRDSLRRRGAERVDENESRREKEKEKESGNRAEKESEVYV